ncbi:MAG: Trm112 family protein [Candidatus Geothermarchaeales archaeon]
MKRELMDILACPICRFEELELIVLKEDREIEEGAIYCPDCGRFYPIIDSIPVMLPDELRERKEDVSFLKKWRDALPQKIVLKGKPINLETFKGV